MNKKIYTTLTTCFLLLSINLFPLNFTHSRIPLQDSKGNIWRSYSNIIKDANGDGLNDIFIINDNQLYLYLMQKDFTYTSSPSQVIDIPFEVGAIDVGDVYPDKGNEIALIYLDGLYCFTFKDNSYNTTPVKIIDERTIFTVTRRGDVSSPLRTGQGAPAPITTQSPKQIAFLSFVFDFDNDGQDDVILPQMEGFVIYFQDKNRNFTQSTSIFTGREISINFFTKNETYPEEIFFYSQRQFGKNLNFFDFNRDGKMDIIKFRFTDFSSLDKFSSPDSAQENEKDMAKNIFFDEIDVFLQNNQKQFPDSPSFTVRIPRYAMESYNLLDINGDGHTDLLFKKIFGNVAEAKTRIRIILGEKSLSPETSVISFPTESTQIIRTKDLMKYGRPSCIDINNDGALDLYLFYINISPTSAHSMIKAFFEKGIPGKIRFYLFDKDKNRYPGSPNYEQKISIGYNLFDFSYEKPNISLEGDFNGDKKKDLVIQTEKCRLSIYRFIDDRKGFENTPFTTITSKPIKRFFIFDLNNDGISDIITKEKVSESLTAPSPFLHIYLSKNL